MQCVTAIFNQGLKACLSADRDYQDYRDYDAVGFG